MVRIAPMSMNQYIILMKYCARFFADIFMTIFCISYKNHNKHGQKQEDNSNHTYVTYFFSFFHDKILISTYYC